MVRIGLTGGIGAGKSAVAKILADLGATIIDADAIAREVVAPGTPGLAAVATEFGPDVLSDDVSLDRKKLGRIVFADPSKLAALNAIVHPLVATRTQEIVDSLPRDAVQVHDVPLITENNLAHLYDKVLVVQAPVETRLRRLAATRGMSEEIARERMAAQATDEQRAAIADVVVINDGTLEDLRHRVSEVWPQLTV